MCPVRHKGFFVMRRNWTKAEEKWLGEQYAVSSKEVLMKELRRSWSSICGKVQKMGLKRDIALTRSKYRNKPQREWSDEDTQYLLENYATAPRKDLILYLGRTWLSIKGRAYEFGLSRCRITSYQRATWPDQWSKEEEKVLKAMYYDAEPWEIKERLPDREWRGIQQRAHKMRLFRRPLMFYREKELKVALDKIFPTELFMDNVRPKWLINPQSGRRLELDRYYPNRNLAFEYNGPQHYRVAPFFYGAEAEQKLKEQQQRDNIKRRLCSKQNIALVVFTCDQSLEVENVRRVIREVQCPN